MQRRSHLLALGVCGALAAPTAAAQDLTVVSWGGSYQDAQRQVYFEPFAAETGTRIVEDTWDGGIGVIRARVEGGDAGWDVVQVETEELLIGCEEGLLQPIDWERIGPEDEFIPGAVHECGVGTIVWSTVLAYDAERLDEAPTSWADFFDLEAFPGKRGLRRGPKFALEFALIADGVAPEEVYDVLRTEDGVERAFAKLETIKPEVIWWEAGAQPPQLLAAGEVAMTSVYNGRLTAPRQEGRDFRIVWDGSIYAIDYWVILEGSNSVDEAYEFIRFASQPEHQKDLPQTIDYGVTHIAAAEVIDPEILPWLPTAPDNLAVAIEIDEEFWVENIDRLNERFNRWVAR
jgi:putative spermidine/putrescine transport system substrate-binding protein